MATKAELLTELQKIHPETKARQSWSLSRVSVCLAQTRINRGLLDEILALNPESLAKMSYGTESLESSLRGAKEGAYRKDVYARATELLGAEAPEYGESLGSGEPSPGETAAREHLWTLTRLLPQLTQANADLRYYKAKGRWLEKLFRDRRAGKPTLDDKALLELAGEFVFALSRAYISRPTDADGNTIEKEDTPS